MLTGFEVLLSTRESCGRSLKPLAVPCPEKTSAGRVGVFPDCF